MPGMGSPQAGWRNAPGQGKKKKPFRLAILEAKTTSVTYKSYKLITQQNGQKDVKVCTKHVSFTASLAECSTNVRDPPRSSLESSDYSGSSSSSSASASASDAEEDVVCQSLAKSCSVAEEVVKEERQHFFEGVEKLLEVWFTSSKGDFDPQQCDLRKIPRYAMFPFVGCT